MSCDHSCDLVYVDSYTDQQGIHHLTTRYLAGESTTDYSTETWTNLRTRFSTPGVSEIAADMYAAYSMKLSSTHNLHPDMERMNMLFECLVVNRVDFDDSV